MDRLKSLALHSKASSGTISLWLQTGTMSVANLASACNQQPRKATNNSLCGQPCSSGKYEGESVFSRSDQKKKLSASERFTLRRAGRCLRLSPSVGLRVSQKVRLTTGPAHSPQLRRPSQTLNLSSSRLGLGRLGRLGRQLLLVRRLRLTRLRHGLGGHGRIGRVALLLGLLDHLAGLAILLRRLALAFGVALALAPALARRGAFLVLGLGVAAEVPRLLDSALLQVDVDAPLKVPLLAEADHAG